MRDRLERWAPLATPALLALLVLFSVLAGIGPGRQTPIDVSQIEQRITEQLVLIERQVELTGELLDAQRVLVERSGRLVELGQTTVRQSTEIETLVRRIARLTAEIRDDVREMNRRTGGAITR